MCRPTLPKEPKPLRVLVSLESYESTSSASTKDEGDDYDTHIPSLTSCALTGVLVVLFLMGTEQICRVLFDSIAHWHPLLENETNRHILARHVGVDALSCLIASMLGWCSRDVNQSVVQYMMFGQKDMEPKPSGHLVRLYTYVPSGFRVSLFFFFYQVKNLYDTIVWGDGPEFIFHHVFSLLTAFGAMHPGCGHFYALFFFGTSEVSTAVLCLLANFDDIHGVPGLGDAFPIGKVVLGAAFVVLFIICRCILWPIYAYQFSKDCLLALNNKDPKTMARRGWMRFFLVSLGSLTVLQIAWLGQIFILAKEEFGKAGLL